MRQPRNLGYGGNQKFGYRWAIEQGLDVVVLLHGDGQYAPELLADMVEPIVAGDAEVVLGSRMLQRGAARKGGMPAYKLIGNRILTRFQNTMTGMSLSEWHSGYRAFSVAALAHVPFEANSDGFDFDTEVLLQLVAAGDRIVEVAIPTYYGDEICYVDGVRYARDVASDVVRYRLARIGFGTPQPGTEPPEYEWKPDEGSSHAQLLDILVDRPPGRVLDLGCGSGRLGAELEERGHHVVGVDVHDTAEAKERLDHFVVADLEQGIPLAVHEHGPYDTVVAADVLEHVRDPGRLLVELRPLLADGAVVLASVPNIGHWYPRLRVVSGRFDYDARGILDRDHVRFFTRRSFARLAQRSGWRITATRPTGLPFDVVERGGRARRGDPAAPHGRLARPHLRPGVAGDVRLPVRAHAQHGGSAPVYPRREEIGRRRRRRRHWLSRGRNPPTTPSRWPPARSCSTPCTTDTGRRSGRRPRRRPG